MAAKKKRMKAEDIIVYTKFSAEVLSSGRVAERAIYVLDPNPSSNVRDITDEVICYGPTRVGSPGYGSPSPGVGDLVSAVASDGRRVDGRRWLDFGSDGDALAWLVDPVLAK